MKMLKKDKILKIGAVLLLFMACTGFCMNGVSAKSYTWNLVKGDKIIFSDSLYPHWTVDMETKNYLSYGNTNGVYKVLNKLASLGYAKPPGIIPCVIGAHRVYTILNKKGYVDIRYGKDVYHCIINGYDKIPPVVMENNTKKYKKVKAQKQSLKILFSKNITSNPKNLKKIIVKTSKGKKIKVQISIKGKYLLVKIPKISKNTKFTITIPKDIIRDTFGNILKKMVILKYLSK